MLKDEEEFKKWSDGIASLAADALIDAKIITKEQFDESVSIIGEELFIRLIMGDYPNPLKKNLLDKSE